jgi:hypothetical protein
MIEKTPKDEGDRDQIEKLPPTDRKSPPEGIEEPTEKGPSDKPLQI